MEFDVKRQHFGDKMYLAGETRTAEKADVQHLIDAGVLVEAKAEKPVKNKAEKPVEAKAEKPLENKGE